MLTKAQFTIGIRESLGHSGVDSASASADGGGRPDHPPTKRL